MKVCFVGVGSIARRHIKNLHQLCSERNIQLTIDAIRRPSSNILETPELVSNVYTSVSELQEEYDVIFLTNPTEYHAEMLIQLHDHGRNFFIEKPIASLDSVDRIAQLKLRPESIYYVACPLRYTNVIQFLKKEIDPNTVNCVRSISSSYLPEWRPGTDYRKTYSAHKDMGGGVAIDLIHEWDYITFLFGMPSEVKSFIGKVSNLEIDSDDYAIYIAQYGHSMVAELHLDYFGRKTIRTVEIFTDNDVIVGDLVAGEVRYLKSGRVVDLREERDAYQKRELGYFIDMIYGKADSQNGIKEAVKVLKLTQGIVVQ